ncbi:putative Chloroperoxidase [Seiridium cardinale]|uniref:Chloroperoxidase n=1 Tax=Seiridium cardinale TaxID=138064 RepID=A0ABR2XH88_9PEZI
MHLPINLICALAAPVVALSSGSEYSVLPEWHPPGAGDVRAPCPMLNTLANHGYLPHDGKGISLNTTIDVFDKVLNIGVGLATELHGQAVATNPTPNATTFDLDNLSRHNILEHDASLSRADYYWTNDSHSFNQTVFDETRSYWKGPIIDIKEAAAARIARVHTSQATNPTYSMSEVGGAFSVGETAAYIIVLGDKVTGTVKKSFVEYLFENERLPTSLGWSRTNETIVDAVLGDMMARVENATEVSAAKFRRVGMHSVPRL